MTVSAAIGGFFLLLVGTPCLQAERHSVFVAVCFSVLSALQKISDGAQRALIGRRWDAVALRSDSEEDARKGVSDNGGRCVKDCGEANRTW